MSEDQPPRALPARPSEERLRKLARRSVATVGLKLAWTQAMLREGSERQAFGTSPGRLIGAGGGRGDQREARAEPEATGIRNGVVEVRVDLDCPQDLLDPGASLVLDWTDGARLAAAGRPVACEDALAPDDDRVVARLMRQRELKIAANFLTECQGPAIIVGADLGRSGLKRQQRCEHGEHAATLTRTGRAGKVRSYAQANSRRPSPMRSRRRGRSAWATEKQP